MVKSRKIKSRKKSEEVKVEELKVEEKTLYLFRGSCRDYRDSFEKNTKIDQSLKRRQILTNPGNIEKSRHNCQKMSILFSKKSIVTPRNGWSNCILGSTQN